MHFSHTSHSPYPLIFLLTVSRRPLPPFISLPIHHRLQNLTMRSQVPEKKLISKENEAENQMEMLRSALSATRRSQMNAVTLCFFHLITTESLLFPPPTGLMSSWPSVLACWWLSFCFTSSSPAATHPKRPYSLVINTALSLSQPDNMFPNLLTLQVNLRAATFCGLISPFPELSHETQTVPTGIPCDIFKAA